MWKFWEWLDGRNQRPFSAWRLALPTVERARLDDKMRAVQVFGIEAPCLKGPISGYRHLYKIRVQGPTQALRPILCRGPFDMDGEFTMLIGAREIQRNWDPPGALGDAEARRLEVASDPSRRVRYEVPQP